MRLPVFVCMMMMCALYSAAQQPQTHLVKAGQSPDNVIPTESKYFLPKFTEGVAYLRNGAASRYSFNYSRLLDEMQFLTPAGDTLTIAEPSVIKYIQLDSSIFYYEKGYLREVEKSGDYKLVIKERLLQMPDKVEGAYGTTSGTSAITTYSNIYTSGTVYKLNVRRDVLFVRVQAFFIGDRFNHFERADKKGFADVFSDKRTAITEYIKKEKINFSYPDDIKKLFLFCTQK